MPGICICAPAGLANKAAAPSKSLRAFRENSFERSAPGQSAEDAVDTYDQQLQFLLVRVLHRQPPLAAQPQFCSSFVSLRCFIFVSFSALLQASESPYSSRTVVQSQALQSLSIGKLAAAGGVGVETIRFYQRRGLLETPTRGDGIRRYGAEDLRRLRFIKQAQAAGFTLGEIKELLDLDASEDRSRARELAQARVQALDERISELQGARDALRRLARECGSGRAGPCPILTSFED